MQKDIPFRIMSRRTTRNHFLSKRVKHGTHTGAKTDKNTSRIMVFEILSLDIIYIFH